MENWPKILDTFANINSSVLLIFWKVRHRDYCTHFTNGKLSQGLRKNRICALVYYFRAFVHVFPYLTLRGDCVASNVVVSISGEGSGLREVMGPVQGPRVNKWWHQCPLAALAPDITLFSTSNYLSIEYSSAIDTGTKWLWLLGKQMIFPGPWTSLLPRFKIYIDGLLNPPIASPPKQGKM